MFYVLWGQPLEILLSHYLLMAFLDHNAAMVSDDNDPY